MNPYFRTTAAPAPASAPAPALPAQSRSSQPTATAAARPMQAPLTTQPAYPSPRAAPRAAPGPSSSTNPAAPPAPAPRPGPVRRRPFDAADLAARAAATRAVPYDLWRPGAGAVRYYPANRHDPPPPNAPPSTAALMRRHSLLQESLRYPPPPSPIRANRANRAPPRPRGSNLYDPATDLAVPTPAPAPAPAPAGQPPTAARAQNPYNYYPTDSGRR